MVCAIQNDASGNCCFQFGRALRNIIRTTPLHHSLICAETLTQPLLATWCTSLRSYLSRPRQEVSTRDSLLKGSFCRLPKTKLRGFPKYGIPEIRSKKNEKTRDRNCFPPHKDRPGPASTVIAGAPVLHCGAKRAVTGTSHFSPSHHDVQRHTNVGPTWYFITVP